MIEFERLVVERRRESVGQARRFDVECRVGPSPILNHDLGHKTLDERMADAAIHGSDEIQPVRRQSRRQVRHVDDAPTA